MKLSDLPDKMLRRMRPEDRKALGKQAMTAEEAIARYTIKSEKDLQNQIGDLLRLRGIWFWTSAMHKATSCTIGAPDFLLCVKGFPMAFEVKLPGKKPEAHQIACHEAMAKNGWCVYVVTSLDQVRAVLDAIK